MKILAELGGLNFDYEKWFWNFYWLRIRLFLERGTNKKGFEIKWIKEI